MALLLNGSNYTITGLQINSANIVNGSIVNDDINASAAIAGTKISGGVGKILQVVQTVKTDVFNTDVINGQISGDITGLTVTITPSNASNKILISTSINAGFQDSTPTRMGATIYKAGSVLSGAIGDSSGNIQRVSFGQELDGYGRTCTLTGQYLDTAGSTNATLYSVRISHGSSSDKAIFINRVSSSAESNHSYHMRAISTITAMEVAA